MLFSRSGNLAIDLGNTNTLLRDQHHLLLSEPSVLIVDEDSHRIEAVGEQAYAMLEKTHHHLKPIRPLRGGVISDGESAKQMMRALAGVPYDTTPVEKRALRDTLDQFSARHTHLVHEPLAAALGMGLNIQEPEGKLVVDIGGGITEVVVISLSGVVAFQSVRVAGDTLDEEIQDYFRREHHLAIGLKTAEQLKKELGCVYEPIASSTIGRLVKGKDLREGIPSTRWVNEAEISRVLDRPFRQIESCIHQSLEACPPELAGDLYRTGMFVTGGHARLTGLAERFHKLFQIPVHVDPQALLSVSKGIAHILNRPAAFRSVLM